MQSVTFIVLASLLSASALASALNQPQPQPESVQHHQHPSVSNVVPGGMVQPAPQAPAVVGAIQEQQAVGPQPAVHMIQEQAYQPAPSGYQSAGPSNYHPQAAGMIQVVGEQQQQPIGASGQKPGNMMVRSVAGPVEQYGQPESASIPANYKPFGSWGLYIGGNPADGYYTDYYKTLGNSVNKQQQQQQQQQVAAGPVNANQVSAFSPVLKQASSSPYVGADYYPFAYSPNEFNSAYQMQMAPIQPGQQSPASIGGPMMSSLPSSSSSSPSSSSSGSPAPGVPQVYSSGGFVQPEAPMIAYADQYAGSTKRFGSLGASGQQQAVVAAAAAAKTYGAGQKMMAPVGAYQSYSPSAPQPPKQAQVFAYPVPVGSQMVGSQQGVEGAFMPYGVHAFTRYAVKPTTMLNSPESGYYYSQPGVQYQAYKPQANSQQQVAYSPPAGYYGPPPMAQLHYSSADSVYGQQQQQQQPGSPIVGGQQVGVMDSPVASFVHHPSVQFEASASETSSSSASVASVPVTDKESQKSKVPADQHTHQHKQ